jgi:uncharacterized protein
MLKIRITITALCLLALMVSGCVEQPRTSKPSMPPAQTLTEQANNALSQAASSIAPQQQLYQLTAAELFVKAGNAGKALIVLGDISPDPLSPQQFAKYTLTYAELALANDYFFLARQLLSDQRIEQSWQQLSLPQQQLWYQLRGELFSLLGEHKNSIDAYVALSELSPTSQARQEAHDKLWFALNHITHEELEELAITEQDQAILGWFTLTNITRQNQGDVRQQLTLINEWRKNQPDHPASLTPPTSLLSAQQAFSDLPQQVALLLPLQGTLAQAGAAIRNGFLAARYDVLAHHGETPIIRFYDTTTSDDISSLYQQAVTDGAQLIIGPLQKEKVRQLRHLPKLPVPTIALNYVESPSLSAPKNFFQFGLSATDEAKQIADRAWIEGQRTALSITPNSGWGDRTLSAFRDRWHKKGGTLIESPPYGTSQTDFAPLLKPALHLDHSNARNQRLQQLLGKPLTHTPRRRQDIDMVFMAAYPDHARQIKPTLDFLFASDLKIYGTSHLYAGVKDTGRNRDLEGIRFSAMPWTLPGATNEKLQPATELPALYRHMFALGIDTYHLHQWLALMVQQPDTRLFGSTGTLQLNPQGAIEREQPWAVFRGGKVQSAQQLTAD